MDPHAARAAMRVSMHASCVVGLDVDWAQVCALVIASCTHGDAAHCSTFVAREGVIGG